MWLRADPGRLNQPVHESGSAKRVYPYRYPVIPYLASGASQVKVKLPLPGVAAIPVSECVGPVPAPVP